MTYCMVLPMKTPINTSWQLSVPIQAIALDCDGTLSRIEGIDEVAKQNRVGDEVRRMTTQAMNETGVTADLYQKRMTLVKPKRRQLIELGQRYYFNRTPDMISVIAAFKELGKEVHIVSAGMNPAVKIFGGLIGIPEKNIYAVNVFFDKDGNYIDYDHNAPTTDRDGKREIIKKLKTQYRHIVHVGDGMNDYETYDLVDRFIGYGGVYYREQIAKLCEFYIKSSSLSPLITLLLTQNEVERLSETTRKIYYKGLDYITAKEVLFNRGDFR